MACAPPTAYTSSMPRSAQVASTTGSGRPPWSFCGGDATASDPTPAACAATTFMTTDDGYTARPPGTYRPTRRTGTHRCRTCAPGASSTVKSAGRWAPCTWRTRRMVSSSADRTSGSSAPTAAAITSDGTRRCTGRTPSNRSARSRSSAAPRVRTAARMGATISAACSTSTSARGSSSNSSRRDRVRPRRSMRVITFPSIGRTTCTRPDHDHRMGRALHHSPRTSHQGGRLLP